jgi:DNA-directed RNA polymerase subunit RPC12/RpoP
MASGRFIACPSCNGRFFVGDEFFELPEARCHCPYCGHRFPVSPSDAAAAAPRQAPA